MKIRWNDVFKVGITVLNAVIPGVSVVETIARQIPALKGKQKQDAVVELVKQSLATAENFAAKDLADDADVEQATRGVIDAVVALNNLIAAKTAAGAKS
jgi:hypothetical protein